MRAFAIMTTLTVFLFVYFTASAIASDQNLFQEDHWYNDGMKIPVWQMTDQYVELNRSINMTNDKTKFSGHAYKVKPLSENAKPEQLPASQKALLSPVYQVSPNPNAAKMILTGNVLVHFSEDWNEQDVVRFMSRYKTVERQKLPFGKGIYLFRSETVSGSLALANAIYSSGKVKAAYPDWMVLDPLR